MVKRVWAAIVTGAVLSMGSVSGAHAAEQVNSCLTAEGPETYRVCAALEGQPAYEYVGSRGSRVGVPGGSTLMEELAGAGQSPSHNPAGFRGSARKSTGAYYARKGGVAPKEGPCLGAGTYRAYVLCAALWGQPSYERTDEPGLSSPAGSEILAELAGEGITPDRTPQAFAREGERETGRYFDAVSHV